MANLEYELLLIDPYGVECARLKDKVKVGPGDSSPVFLSIPGDLVSGDYKLVCYIKKKTLESFVRVLRIDGMMGARIEVGTESESYFYGEPITIITDIMDGMGQDAILSLKVYSGEGDWRIHREIKGWVTSMKVDGDYLWVGTNGGLYRYDKKRDLFTRYHRTENLSSSPYYGLVHDGETLWISSHIGLLEYRIPVTKERVSQEKNPDFSEICTHKAP